MSSGVPQSRMPSNGLATGTGGGRESTLPPVPAASGMIIRGAPSNGAARSTLSEDAVPIVFQGSSQRQGQGHGSAMAATVPARHTSTSAFAPAGSSFRRKGRMSNVSKVSSVASLPAIDEQDDRRSSPSTGSDSEGEAAWRSAAPQGTAPGGGGGSGSGTVYPDRQRGTSAVLRQPPSMPSARAARGAPPGAASQSPSTAKIHQLFGVMKENIAEYEKSIAALQRTLDHFRENSDVFDSVDLERVQAVMDAETAVLGQTQRNFDESQALYETKLIDLEQKIHRRQQVISAVDSELGTISKHASLCKHFGQGQAILQNAWEHTLSDLCDAITKLSNRAPSADDVSASGGGGREATAMDVGGRGTQGGLVISGR